MSKAAELAALIANVNKGSSLANKNFITNGGMQIWQRATAATAAVDGAYKTVDRFFNWVNGGGAYTTEQSTGHLATTGHENALKLAVTTADTSIAAGDYYVIGYKIEAQNLQSFKYGSSSANAVTLSFWIRATKAGTHTLFFSKNDSTQYIYVAEYTISASDTWEHITITIEPDSNIKAGAGAIANDNGAGITIGFVLKEGSNYEGATANAWNTSKYTTSNQVNNMDSTSNTWYLTGVQLEIGKATEFEHEPYETTLRKCQRYYYEHIRGVSGSRKYVGTGEFYTTSQLNCNISFPTTMRTTPTLVQGNGTDYFGWWGGSQAGDISATWNLFIPSENTTSMYLNPDDDPSASGIGARIYIKDNNSVSGTTNAFIALNAEL